MKSSIFIPYLLRDGAILQRNQENRFWGYTGSEQEVTLLYEEILLKTKSDEKGFFDFILPTHETSESIDFKISTVDTEIVLKDICFGDVFLLSGQSNMQLWMERLKTRYTDEIERAQNPWIRYFEVPQEPSFDNIKTELTSGQWKRAIGEELKNLSGIGYFFAKEKFSEDGLPIGLITTAVGGTPLNAWLSEESLTKFNSLPPAYNALKNKEYLKEIQNLDKLNQDSYQKLCEETDEGLHQSWQNPNLDDKDWSEISLSETWNEKYTFPGTLWLRKKLQISDEFIGKMGELRFGTMTDADVIYVNGKKVGNTDYKYPPRNYKISKLTKSFTIAIRLKIYNAPGGITRSKPHILLVGENRLDLNHGWKIRRSSTLPERHKAYFINYEPTGLYNGMIVPLQKLKFAAILWYQGESDAGSPQNYGPRFRELIESWRKLFKQPYLPFLYVQLPNCDTEKEADWARLREEQKEGLKISRTAMVVTIGDGEDDDLHPLNKKDVAHKLLNAYHNVKLFPNGYCIAPLAKEAIQGKKNVIILSFETFGKKFNVEKNKDFELFQGGHSYKVRDYRQVEEQIILELPATLSLQPDAKVRYNWSNAPQVFIWNEEGYPASPFELNIQ
ncbi:sialate O-acetylesterase [Lactococcus lactis]|uniref:Sialate O-acetylesterase n=1 Tax=Lactococcus lactis TaxID=1358 RepID=A0AB35KCM3_9LACT|nr:sialate O-acetylesterase [Lactococcus lactis]MDG4979738.1 sialate O-acetylesterase [Lactococcus lactis]MDG5049493.1 sialate O-acetylesterase [Lactococcus lactis]